MNAGGYTVCGQNVELLNVKLEVHVVTTWS